MQCFDCILQNEVFTLDVHGIYRIPVKRHAHIRQDAALQVVVAIQLDFVVCIQGLATRVLQGEHTVVCPEPENPYSPHLAFL